MADVMRQAYRVLSEEDKAAMGDIKRVASDLFDYVTAAEEDHSRSRREFALAKTKIEEAVMWAVKGITA